MTGQHQQSEQAGRCSVITTNIVTFLTADAYVGDGARTVIVIVSHLLQRPPAAATGSIAGAV
jgi:hypothetical protein